MFRRCVSEIVSSAILTLIVISVGAGIVVYATYVYSLAESKFRHEKLKLEKELKTSISVLFAYGVKATNTLRLAMVAGDFPTEILAIYVEDKLYDYEVTLNPYQVVVLDIDLDNLGINLADYPLNYRLEVKIVYEGGEVIAYAQIL